MGPSKMPRARSREGAPRIAWSTALVYVKVWRTVSQSPSPPTPSPFMGEGAFDPCRRRRATCYDRDGSSSRRPTA
jgi:hypothetical protein